MSQNASAFHGSLRYRRETVANVASVDLAPVTGSSSLAPIAAERKP